MGTSFSLTIHGATQEFDALESILEVAGISSERVKPIQFSTEPPDTTVLIVAGMVLKALVGCFRIYMREKKRKITLVKGHTFTQVENCTDEQIEKALSESPTIFIEDSKE